MGLKRTKCEVFPLYGVRLRSITIIRLIVYKSIISSKYLCNMEHIRTLESKNQYIYIFTPRAPWIYLVLLDKSFQ